jgi:hypothetical protein
MFDKNIFYLLIIKNIDLFLNFKFDHDDEY